MATDVHCSCSTIIPTTLYFLTTSSLRIGLAVLRQLMACTVVAYKKLNTFAQCQSILTHPGRTIGPSEVMYLGYVCVEPAQERSIALIHSRSLSRRTPHKSSTCTNAACANPIVNHIHRLLGLEERRWGRTATTTLASSSPEQPNVQPGPHEPYPYHCSAEPAAVRGQIRPTLRVGADAARSVFEVVRVVAGEDEWPRRDVADLLCACPDS